MGRQIRKLRDALRQGDLILLLLCIIATAFGCLVISSATNYMGAFRYVAIQILAAVIGIALYVFFSSVDIEFFSEHRTWLVVFNICFLSLLIPFGETISGNRSWIDLQILPFNIQVAEVCKISFILIMASVMSSHQNKISSVRSVFHMAFHLILLFGLNFILSKDMGVSLIFVFIFIGMAYGGGVNLIWFGVLIGAVILFFPILWNVFFDDYQKLRIEVLFNPNLDPTGIGPRYHTMHSLRSLTGGGMTGQGLYSGHRTQQGALFAQHTDYIFSAIGEELGYVGCILVVVILAAIVARCIWVGNRSQDYPRRLICYGAASALIFQIVINIGMCIGLLPVIGLTLPFISYGGSSLVSLFAMLGLVSGVYARPAPTSHERYIRPPYYSKMTKKLQR